LGAQHEQHRDRRQPDDPDHDQQLVESIGTPASDYDVSREETGRPAPRARKAEGARTIQLPRVHGPRPEQHHASRHRHPLRHEFPRRDGGRRIVIITPRVIGFREASNRPRTYDYPFTLFEMRFDRSGKGEGRMAYATQINFDKKKNAIELENYSSEPVRLNNLTLEVKK
jgi:hypothetical protein